MKQLVNILLLLISISCFSQTAYVGVCETGYTAEIATFCNCSWVTKVEVCDVNNSCTKLNMTNGEWVLHYDYLANLAQPIAVKIFGVGENCSPEVPYIISIFIDESCKRCDCTINEQCVCECENELQGNSDCSLGDITVWNSETCELDVLISTVYGCTIESSCNYNPSANCNDGSCIIPIECCEDFECPVGAICANTFCECPPCEEVINLNGVDTCVPVCGESAEAIGCDPICPVPTEYLCPDGTIMSSCFDCFCFDVTFFFDFSTSMNTIGFSGDNLAQEMVLAANDVTTSLMNLYPNTFTFSYYGYSSGGNEAEILSCVGDSDLSLIQNTLVCPTIIDLMNGTCGGAATCTCSGTEPSPAINLAANNVCVPACENSIPMLVLLTDGVFSASSAMIDAVSLWQSNLTSIQQGYAQTVGIQFNNPPRDCSTGLSAGMVEFIDLLPGGAYCGGNVEDLFIQAVNSYCVPPCIDSNQGVFICNPCPIGTGYVDGNCIDTSVFCESVFVLNSEPAECVSLQFDNYTPITCNPIPLSYCYETSNCTESALLPVDSGSGEILLTEVCTPDCPDNQVWNFTTESCQLGCGEGFVLFESKCRPIINCNNTTCTNIGQVESICYCLD